MSVRLKEITPEASEMREIVLEYPSDVLQRLVRVHLLFPADSHRFVQPMPVLWLNDGQDMEALQLSSTLENLMISRKIKPVFTVAIEAGDRIQEYGTIDVPDYKNRGAKARAYADFLTTELIPHIRRNYPVSAAAADNVFAGFSLGGVSAFDFVWNYPQYFQKAGVFSGAFWWRKKALNQGYTDNDRIVHQRIRMGRFKPGLKFWLQTGTLDETADRNKNGVIDSIDDTLDLITELIIKGYKLSEDITYVEVEGGKHNPGCWAKILPEFLQWAFKNN